MATVESVLKEIAAAGFLVNNLFQRRALDPTGVDGWQANVRTQAAEASYFEFGTGATPVAALQAALAKTVGEAGLPHRNNMPKFLQKAHVDVKEPKAASLEDLL